MNEETLKNLEKRYKTGNYFVIAKWEHKSKVWYEQRIKNPFQDHLNNATEVKLIHNRHIDIFQAYIDNEFEIGLNEGIVKDFVESYCERFDYVVMKLCPKTNKKENKGGIMKSFTQNKFTPKDLKTGYVCKHRDGRFSMVMLNTSCFKGEMVFSDGGRTSLEHFDENFKWYYNIDYIDANPNYDIIKIYRPKKMIEGFKIFENPSQVDTTYWTLLWQEEETIEMTLEEICQELGKNIKIVK